jgi:hypothetical protein
MKRFLNWFSILRPMPETLKKISVVRKLLREGVPIYKAVREAKLGWKNFYKYAPLIYDDPEIFVPLPKGFIRECEYRGMNVEDLRIVLDCVAKYEASEIIGRALARGKPLEVRRKPGEHWLRVCKELEMNWIHELLLSTLR